MDQPAIDFYGLQPSPLRLGPGWREAFATPPLSPLAWMPEPARNHGPETSLASPIPGLVAWLRGH